jgi:hypothetical protein
MNADIEALADFICNGIEHGTYAENVAYLMDECGLTKRQARNLHTLGVWMMALPPMKSDELNRRIVAALEE